MNRAGQRIVEQQVNKLTDDEHDQHNERIQEGIVLTINKIV